MKIWKIEKVRKNLTFTKLIIIIKYTKLTIEYVFHPREFKKIE